ncbi:MAG: hypothetical protein M1827_003072 [Pycnora praestabilis]|nr:MAG: hypothetical protein M1827_003072 [Pycnora praestabilis]
MAPRRVSFHGSDRSPLELLVNYVGKDKDALHNTAEPSQDPFLNGNRGLRQQAGRVSGNPGHSAWVKLSQCFLNQEITLLTSMLDCKDDNLCRRFEPQSFCLIVDVLLYTEPCLARERGLYLLVESLQEPSETTPPQQPASPPTSIGLRKEEIGAKTLSPLLKCLIDPTRDEMIRRWVGLLILELLRNCERNKERIDLAAEYLRRSLGRIITDDGSQIIKFIAGSLIREMLEAGASAEDFFPVGVDQITIQQFPRNPFESSQWISEFEEFLDELDTQQMIAPTERNLYFAEVVSAGDRRFTDNEGSILVTVGEMVNIVIPASRNAPTQFIDLPLDHIQTTEVQQTNLLTHSANASENFVVDVLLRLTDGPLGNYRLNAAKETAADIHITFEHIESANDLKADINVGKAYLASHLVNSEIKKLSTVRQALDISKIGPRISISHKSLKLLAEKPISFTPSHNIATNVSTDSTDRNQVEEGKLVIASQSLRISEGMAQISPIPWDHQSVLSPRDDIVERMELPDARAASGDAVLLDDVLRPVDGQIRNSVSDSETWREERTSLVVAELHHLPTLQQPQMTPDPDETREEIDLYGLSPAGARSGKAFGVFQNSIGRSMTLERKENGFNQDSTADLEDDGCEVDLLLGNEEPSPEDEELEREKPISLLQEQKNVRNTTAELKSARGADIQMASINDSTGEEDDEEMNISIEKDTPEGSSPLKGESVNRLLDPKKPHQSHKVIAASTMKQKLHDEAVEAVAPQTTVIAKKMKDRLRTFTGRIISLGKVDSIREIISDEGVVTSDSTNKTIPQRSSARKSPKPKQKLQKPSQKPTNKETLGTPSKAFRDKGSIYDLPENRSQDIKRKLQSHKKTTTAATKKRPKQKHCPACWRNINGLSKAKKEDHAKNCHITKDNFESVDIEEGRRRKAQLARNNPKPSTRIAKVQVKSKTEAHSMSPTMTRKRPVSLSYIPLKIVGTLVETPVGIEVHGEEVADRQGTTKNTTVLHQPRISTAKMVSSPQNNTSSVSINHKPEGRYVSEKETTTRLSHSTPDDEEADSRMVWDRETAIEHAYGSPDDEEAEVQVGNGQSLAKSANSAVISLSSGESENHSCYSTASKVKITNSIAPELHIESKRQVEKQNDIPKLKQSRFLSKPIFSMVAQTPESRVEAKTRSKKDQTQHLLDDQLLRKTPIVSFSKNGPLNQGIIPSKNTGARSGEQAKTSMRSHRGIVQRHLSRSQPRQKGNEITLEGFKSINATGFLPKRKRGSMMEDDLVKTPQAKRYKSLVIKPRPHEYLLRNVIQSSSSSTVLSNQNHASQGTRVAENGSPAPFATLFPSASVVVENMVTALGERSPSEVSKALRDLSPNTTRLAGSEGKANEPEAGLLDLGNNGSDPDIDPNTNAVPSFRIKGTPRSRDTGLIFSSNHKPGPSPPGDKSKAVSGVTVHRVVPGGKFINVLTASVLETTKSLQDPFLSDEPPISSTFVQKLQAQANKSTKPTGKDANNNHERLARKSTIRWTRNEDPDKTLVDVEKEEDSILPRRRGLSTSSSGSSRTTQTSIDLQDREPNVELDIEKEWSDSLKPYQKSTLDILWGISSRLVRHLLEKEAAIEDIVDEYRRGGTVLIKELETAHQQDIGHSKDQLETAENKLRVAFKKFEGFIDSAQRELHLEPLAKLQKEQDNHDRALMEQLQYAIRKYDF